MCTGRGGNQRSWASPFPALASRGRLAEARLVAECSGRRRELQDRQAASTSVCWASTVRLLLTHGRREYRAGSQLTLKTG